ncbi:hypothetical protein ST47_g7214 [Ascochyta rabiei]|uniref:Uncharacterized protein n=1 Tax=Didymella rabiei TaxID=5454 RepID=A0A163B5K3_DIDRA|nr:hypothetical protein ST47_g7214 [Ascochyta rabiei]
MAFLLNQAEGHCYFAGEMLAGRHSHTAPPLQKSSLHSPCLDGVGTLFGSTLREGSYNTSMDISEDEAFASRLDTDITPSTYHTSWLLDGGRPDNSPPTPRLTPIQKLPWLPPSEYSEFQRQREAAKGRHNVFKLDPYRTALEDTPVGSPVDTSCTSVEPGSDDDDDGSAYYGHDHVHDVSSGAHTPSRRNFDSDDDDDDDDDDDRAMEGQDSVIGQPPYSFNHDYLPEDAYNNVNAPEETASSMSNPRHERSIAATRNDS